MTLKSRRGNILVFLSVVVTTGVRTRVTALILAKNPMESDLGYDFSCNNTTVRHAFCVRQNAGKILMPTPSLIPRFWWSVPIVLRTRTSQGSSTSKHHLWVASRCHQQVHRHNKHCASTSTAIVSQARNTVTGNTAVILPTGDCTSP